MDMYTFPLFIYKQGIFILWDAFDFILFDFLYFFKQNYY